MTRNKRYTYNEFGDIHQDGKVFAYSDSERNARTICDKLNEQDAEINRLNKHLHGVLDELYCKDRLLEENNISIECCDKKLEEKWSKDNVG